ncbi:MAG: hypothetical protein CSA95_00910 [Bacteroidetes bacterium]|nr:MAG: hypothetical protein CSA95_00910 [Bacteroidota bacterium]PIE88625.1 MAG: hypothetical protein CSA04_00925 [Bacteroidota bacterium]
MKKKQIRIALFFLLGFGVLFWGINFLKGVDIFNKQITVYSVYPRIEGLNVGAPVEVNGLKIGQVKDIRFAHNNPHRILVEMMLKTDLEIPRSSVARIYSSDLLGTKAIELQLKGRGTPLHSGDTLSSSTETSLMEEVNQQVAPIKLKAENLLASLDTMVVVFHSIFNDSARRNLKASFKSIKQSVDYLKNTSYNIDTLVVSQTHRLAQIVGNVEAITRNIDQHEENISRIITNTSMISDSLAKIEFTETIKRMDKALNQASSMIEKVNEGEGTLGQLMKNDSLYNYLQQSAEELNSLLYDMKHHPERYVRFSVFGRRPSKTPYQDPAQN